MNKYIVAVVLLLASALSAHAEIRRAEIKVFGMD